MPQTLDIISVNLWQILISLANLLLLFLILKRFLFAPVKRMMAQRQARVDEQYAAAEQAQKSAEKMQADWEETMSTAESKAAAIVQAAGESAGRRADKILADARERAEGILHRAEEDAALERKKAEADIKREIVDVSALLAGKMLDREITVEDHRHLIDSFIEEIGKSHDGAE